MSQRQTSRHDAAPAASQTTTGSSSQSRGPQDAPRVLHLRGARNSDGRSVQWAEDVVDNEGLGRKSSKVCCIYHKPKPVDESSDESSSSDSDSSSDDDAGADADRKGKGHACGHGGRHGRSARRSDGKNKQRPPSPNAYEKVPKVKPKESEGVAKP